MLLKVLSIHAFKAFLAINSVLVITHNLSNTSIGGLLYLTEKLNNKGYKHLSLEDRITIKTLLDQCATQYAISKMLKRSLSTIQREIKRHSKVISHTGNDCLIKKQCKRKDTCNLKCFHKQCKSCTRKDCTEHCNSYVQSYCDKLQSSPYVCNGCNKYYSCPYEKRKYNGKEANDMYLAELHDKRSGFDVTEDELKHIDELLSPLIKNGQSPYAALQAVGDKLNISVSTLYRLINAGAISIRNIDLHEKVSRKIPTKKRKSKDAYAVLSKEKIGHLWSDYLKYTSKHDVMTVEQDCVEGLKTDNATLLTLHWRQLHTQIAIIMDKQDSEHIVEALDKIEQALGTELFKQCFLVILTDNGHEFTDIKGMEGSYFDRNIKRTKIFFCEPNRSDEKGSCERNHREMRKIIPKQVTSFEDFTQADIVLMMNHVNSYPRGILGGKCPYDISMNVLPEDFFILLGLEKIPTEEVIMKPKLLQDRVKARKKIA